MVRFMSRVIGLAALATLAGGSPISKTCFDWDDTKYLIAFGDSYTYVQGLEGYPNSTFIGSGLLGELAFTPAELLENRIVQNFTGTAEGGPNWVEFLTGCGLRPGLTAPATCDIQLWDFAFGGSDVSEAFLPLHHNWTVPLVNQTYQYLTYAEPVLKKTIDKSRALVTIWIGINDIGDSLSKLKNVSSYAEFWETEISTIFQQSVGPMFKAGYQNFMFVNLPPLDRTPGNQLKANPAPNITQIGWWDDTLARYSESFAKQNAGATTMLYDANSFLNGVLDNPAKYGLTNTTSYCPAYDQLDVLTDPGKYGCVPLYDYFWYNSGHMTSHVHQHLAADMLEFLRNESI